LGFLDKGDVDVAVKFGYVGRVILYGASLWVVMILLKLARRNMSPSLTVRALTMGAVVGVFLIVQPVHAPLSYSFGLLPLGIALGLIDRERFLSIDRTIEPT
jgi:hypothetical protein